MSPDSHLADMKQTKQHKTDNFSWQNHLRHCPQAASAEWRHTMKEYKKT
jgi:hypothetical protein